MKYEDVNVLPDAIDESSLNVIGTWDSFNITWKPVVNVNFGDIFYEIKIGGDDPVSYLLLVRIPTITGFFSVK